jgi:Rrf2 family protein
MLKLSTRARYALRMMLDVARNGGTETPVSLAMVSERTGLSRGYLEQVAAALRSARLLRAASGRHGGYRLAGPPEEITVGNIIEATIGQVCLVDCLDDPTTCVRAEFCECRMVYSLINNRVTEVLHAYTLADLLDPAWVRSVGNEIAHLPGCPSPPGQPRPEGQANLRGESGT